VAGGEKQREMIFYDGGCGLCHRTVKFVLKHDGGERAGAGGAGSYAFRFAPLQGETYAAMVGAEERGKLPDSIVVRTREGALLARSAAMIHIGRRLGGFWGVAAGAVELVPRGLRDAVYDLVARVRHRLFARPEDACPVVPAEWRARFDP
jgi:predicted DCC family thiol-disulfide oxidoreductase YuxK